MGAHEGDEAVVRAVVGDTEVPTDVMEEHPSHLLADTAFSVVGFGGTPASAAAADHLLAPTATPAGTFAGVSYMQYDGIFEGETATGAFRVPYRITAPANRALGNGTVVVEPPHFAVGLGVLNLYLRRELLFTRGFAHAGIGWSKSLWPGEGNRILDPTVPGTFIDGGFPDLAVVPTTRSSLTSLAPSRRIRRPTRCSATSRDGMQPASPIRRTR